MVLEVPFLATPLIVPPLVILAILILALGLGIFAVYKSMKTNCGILSHILAFILAPFWLIWYYVFGGQNRCTINNIGGKHLDMYSKMINEKYS